MADYTLTINVHTAGLGSCAGAGVYTSPAVVNLTAAPTGSNLFWKWTGSLTGSVNPNHVHMTADRTVDVWFAAASAQTEAVAVLDITDPETSIIGINNIDGAVLKDNSPLTYTDYTAQANEDTANDVPLLPSSPETNDAFFFGVDNITDDYIRYVLNIGTAGAGTWTLTYYYYNGSTWVALPANNVVYKDAQFLNFRTAGLGAMVIIPPSDWTTVSVGGLTKYWIEARVTSL